jgi:hypothetical protein
MPHSSAGLALSDYDRIRETRTPDWQAEVCATLAALFPNARVLVVTRGFRSALLSAYSQFARTGGELDFASVCRLIDELTARGVNPWDYDVLLGLYTSAFREEEVIVLPYELLRDDAEAFTRELEQRLRLDHFPATSGRINTSLSPEELYWYPRFTRAVRALPLGARVRRQLFRLYARGADANRFRGLIRVLQRLWPRAPITAPSVPNETLEAFRGRAESLRSNPLYSPYATEYLWD